MTNEPNNMSHGISFTTTNHLITAHTSYPSNGTSWIIDSGATDHITCSFDNFQNFSKIKPIHINLPNGSVVIAHLSGTVQLSSQLIIRDVLYVPNFKFNLLSISKLLTCADYILNFSNFQCEIQEKKSLKTIGLAKLKHGLYHLETYTKSIHTPPKTTFINNFSTPPVTNSNLWHFRLGHLSGNRLNTLHKSFPFISKYVDENCDICHLAKQKKLSYSPSANRALKPFDLIHMDLWGPFSQSSVHGHKYFLTIVDDFSRYTWIVLLKTKGDVCIHVQNFVSLIENQFHLSIKCIRSDNSPEFLQKHFFASKGILHQTSCIYTPQQNGRVERKHQHILNVARALMFQSQLPKQYWSYAVKHAIYLINCIPSPIIDNKTPFELLHEHNPDFSNLKFFGCLSYASTNFPRQKFDVRAKRGVFLGYQTGTK